MIAYHVRLFETIKTSLPPGIREELRHELTDVYEHLERSLSLATLYYELASDLMDGYITLASHRLHQIAKTLTIVTTVFVPLFDATPSDNVCARMRDPDARTR